MAENESTGSITKALGSIASDVGRCVSEAAERLQDTPIGDMLTSAQTTTKKATRAVSEGLGRMNGTYGYTDIDVWNLGDTQAEHIAKVMRRYADETRHTNAELADETERHAAGIGSFASDLETLSTIGALVRKDGGNADIDERARQRTDGFLADWDWFGSSFITPDYRYDAPADDDGDGTQRQGGMLGNIVLAAAKSTYANASRAKNGVGWIDMDTLPEFEALRMASMLFEYASHNLGFPDGYRGSEREMTGNGRDDAWRDRKISIRLVFSDAVQGRHDDASKPCTSLTNGQMDENFAAWEEDVYQAAEVMEAWGNWLSAYRHGNGTCLAPDTPEIAALHDEFAKCWHWIGQNVTDLWW